MENIHLPIEEHLKLDRCPHCSISHPTLVKTHQESTKDYNNKSERVWYFFKCNSCGGVITAGGPAGRGFFNEVYPFYEVVDDSLPDKARNFLEQSILTLCAPSGAVMLACSSIDEMLKLKGLRGGNLKQRIDEAASDKLRLITKDMAEWAHEVRLESNDIRHADDNAILPTISDAKRIIDFAKQLGFILFVLPARIQKAIAETKTK